MTDEEILLLLAFRMAEVPSFLFFKIYDYFKDLKVLKRVSKEELFQFGISAKGAERICKALSEEKELQKIFSLLKRERISFLTFADPLYPSLLIEIPDKPYLLFYEGSLPKDLPLLAVVGSRNMTAYGKSILPQILTPLVNAGVGVVSGLAYGIDGEAHRLAVNEGGYTIAVLGSGLRHIYPIEHGSLAKKILDAGGLLLSEYPPHFGPKKEYFPERNRIIAGLAQAVLVVEAGFRSGTRITVRFAAEYNRDVLAVPGDITAERSVGTNNLLKEGAFVVTEAEDIASVLNITLAEEKSASLDKIGKLSKNEKKIIEILKESPKPVDKISQKMGLSFREVLISLSDLEVRGLVFRNSQGYYSLK